MIEVEPERVVPEEDYRRLRDENKRLVAQCREKEISVRKWEDNCRELVDKLSGLRGEREVREERELRMRAEMKVVELEREVENIERKRDR